MHDSKCSKTNIEKTLCRSYRTKLTASSRESHCCLVNFYSALISIVFVISEAPDTGAQTKGFAGPLAYGGFAAPYAYGGLAHPGFYGHGFHGAYWG